MEVFAEFFAFFFGFQRAISMLLSRALAVRPSFSALFQPHLKPYQGLYHLLGPAHPKNLDFVWLSQHICKYAEILSKNLKKILISKIVHKKHNFHFNDQKSKNLQNIV